MYTPNTLPPAIVHAAHTANTSCNRTSVHGPAWHTLRQVGRDDTQPSFAALQWSYACTCLYVHTSLVSGVILATSTSVLLTMAGQKVRVVSVVTHVHVLCIPTHVHVLMHPHSPLRVGSLVHRGGRRSTQHALASCSNITIMHPAPPGGAPTYMGPKYLLGSTLT